MLRPPPPSTLFPYTTLFRSIIALPTDMFYNTGIATYVWILDKNKEPKRDGKIQLIDATSTWTSMRKSMGNKRREFSDQDREFILGLYNAFEDADEEYSKEIGRASCRERGE